LQGNGVNLIKAKSAILTYNTKKSVDMSARHGRGGDKNSFVRKEGASQKKIGKH